MNENKRMLVLFGIMIILIILILLIAFWPKQNELFACKIKQDKDYSNLGSINYKEYTCLYESKVKTPIVVSKSLSKDEKKALNNSAKDANIAIYYLSDNITNSELKDIKKDLKTDKTDYKDTSLIVLEKNKVKDALTKDLNKKDEITNFLDENGLVKFAFGAQPDEEYTSISKIDYATYKKLYESDKTFTIIITQTTCGYCKQFKPVINEYAKENNIPVYYIDIDTLSEEDSTALLSSVTYFEENSDWGTPTTLAIKDKKVLSSISGYVSETSRLDTFFKEAKLK